VTTLKEAIDAIPLDLPVDEWASRLVLTLYCFGPSIPANETLPGAPRVTVEQQVQFHMSKPPPDASGFH
jgi:hypothetical protein